MMAGPEVVSAGTRPYDVGMSPKKTVGLDILCGRCLSFVDR